MTASKKTQHDGIVSELRDDGILIVTLDRPEALNPWGKAEREVWNDLMRDVERQTMQCRVVILTGTGRAFSAGGDVTQFGEMFDAGTEAAVAHMQRYQEMARLAWRLPVPVIAAVNGLALGGGTAISLMADLRVASETSMFAIAQAKRGFVPDIGTTYLLPRIVGLARAMELMLLAQPIDAKTALAYGLINRIAAPDAVLSEAIAMAKQILTLPEPAVRWVKRVTYFNLDATFEQALNTETMAESILAGTPDFTKALAAFMSKK